MDKAKTKTATLGVYISKYSELTPANIHNASNEDLAKGTALFAFNGPKEWTRVGTAQVTFSLDCYQDMVASKVQALCAEQKEVLAEAQATSTRIEEQIQSLLAIANEVPA